MKKAIVTGANGFVGAAICKELINEGVNVIGIVRSRKSNTSRIDYLHGIKMVYADGSEYKILKDIVKDRDIDVLYHLAWSGVKGGLQTESEVQIKNIQYACDIVNFCHQIGCERVVFASSIMEYEVQKIMSANIVPPINTLYSTAKVAANYMARAIAGKWGIEYISAIISNTYGPGETNSRFINTSLRKMINGEYCKFTEGNQLYDFIYIDDVAKAFYLIGKKGISNKSYYIGSREQKPLKEFILEMKNLVDENIKIGLGELPYLNKVSLTYDEFDVNLLNIDTGFVPKIPFTEGIERTINWIKNHS